jgi:hypothetical protein
MAKSRRLRQLIARINFLDKNILPPQKIDGNYTHKENDLIRSYLLLVHAEIEAYFEDMVKAKAQKALDEWNRNRKSSRCLLGILAFSGNELNYDNLSKYESNKIDTRINRAVKHFQDSIEKNNVIKKNNIIKMIVPTGIEIDALDDTWLLVMDGFGSTRGVIAHNSLKVQSQLDRNTEKEKISNQILPEIEKIDKLLIRD